MIAVYSVFTYEMPEETAIELDEPLDFGDIYPRS
jgi:hypothetical protein